MIQDTDSIDVSLSEKVRYDCYPEIEAITSKLQGLGSRITDSEQKFAKTKATWQEVYRADQLDESRLEIERLSEYLIMRTEDFSEAQDQLCRGLRSLLALTAYPFLESSYMLRFYGYDIDGETARKVAAKYVKHAKRMISFIERAIEIPHNKTDCVYDWCEELKLLAKAASFGTDVALTQVANKIRGRIGNDINFKKALDSNKHQKNRYMKLAINPLREVGHQSIRVVPAISVNPGGLLYVDKNVTINQSGTGNIANVAEFMSHVTNQVTNNLEKSSSTDEVKVLMKQLADQITAISSRIDSKQTQRMGSDLQTLSNEMAQPEPRRDWYELSLKGLKEATEAVGEIAIPIIATLQKLIPLLV